VNIRGKLVVYLIEQARSLFLMYPAFILGGIAGCVALLCCISGSAISSQVSDEYILQLNADT
jgi:hypothetical protein